MRSRALAPLDSVTPKRPHGVLKKLALRLAISALLALRAPKSVDFGVGALTLTLNKALAFVRCAHKSARAPLRGSLGVTSQKLYLVQFADLVLAVWALWGCSTLFRYLTYWKELRLTPSAPDYNRGNALKAYRIEKPAPPLMSR